MHDLIIIGGGPSGLAAALEATRCGADVSVLERHEQVGGLARTLLFEGCRYDIGPHRFFTKNEEVYQLFMDVVGDDLVRVPRLTRILYRDRFFNYPLTPVNALVGLGMLKASAILGSYGGARLRRALAHREPETFEDWVVDHFGRQLFKTFFKAYTEKVWGIPCECIGADWAAQRIKGLSLSSAMTSAFGRPSKQVIKTLVDEFIYPRLGAGQLYERMAAIVDHQGGTVIKSHTVTRIVREGLRVRAVAVSDARGAQQMVEARFFLSSAPITETLQRLDPPPPKEVLEACNRLRYRNHIGVNLEVEGPVFADNWIYVHSPEVLMARIANYRNFSPAMASEPGISPLTVEYFAFPEQELSRATDKWLIEHAVRELHGQGILEPDQVRRGFVVRSDNAYPVIDRDSRVRTAILKGWMDQLRNLLPIGRSGMFKYNNQDHAMATGLLAARTALGVGVFDPWRVNIDAEYLESATSH